MLGFLFLLFTVVPLLELYFLLMAADKIGGPATFLIVIVTGIVGAIFAKSQGRQLLSNIQLKTAQGQIPTDDMIQGLMVLVGGVLLVTPGFATDALGLSLVFPLTRKLFLAFFRKYFVSKINTSNVKVYTNLNFQSRPQDSSFYSEGGLRDVTPKKLNSDEN